MGEFEFDGVELSMGYQGETGWMCEVGAVLGCEVGAVREPPLRDYGGGGRCVVLGDSIAETAVVSLGSLESCEGTWGVELDAWSGPSFD